MSSALKFLNKNNQEILSCFMRHVLTMLCAIGTLILIGWLVKFSSYGIDFTDESFYLVWISNPFIYDVSVSQFGFIYHPLYSLLGGDIAALRRANIFIIFGLAWGLCYTLLASLAPEVKRNCAALPVAAAGVATSSFIFFGSWLPTPSYNSLALQALLITSIGLILAENFLHRISVVGWLLIGVGGWLAFMAKPSTAIALALCVLFFLLLSRKFSVRMFALAVVSAVALLVASAVLIDGSVLRFFERLQLGSEFSKYLASGHVLTHILRVDDFFMYERFNHAIFLVFSVLFIALWCVWVGSKKLSYVGLIFSGSFFLITSVLVFGPAQPAVNFGIFRGFLIFGVVYAAVFAVLVFGRFKVLVTISASQWAIALIFLIMPHIYAFGTNGNYWQAGGYAAIFWLLAGLTLFGSLIRERASWFFVLPLALCVQAVTAALLQTGFEQPYRQPQSLRINASAFEIGPQRAELILSKGYLDYFASAMAITNAAGFEANTPMIDLSGQSPGILYAFGAESIGQAWTIGGYPGSLKLAQAALALVPCWKIANAWVLFEPDGPRSISAELMTSLGADFPEGYEHVGMWQTAVGAGGYAERRIQQLYKPFEPQDTMMKCQMLRAKVAQ